MLALICGTGRLPLALVGALNPRPLVCSLRGFAPEDLTPDLDFRLEQVGSLIADLKARGVTRLCLAGAIRRPPIDPTLIDAKTMPLVPVMQKAIASGDDGALRGVIGIFESAGFAVMPAHELAPDLVPQAGCATDRQPAEADRADAARGQAVVAAMGCADIGQSCVVHRRQAIAVEALFGTDWMLQSLARRPDGGGGLLFKAPKPEQDRRVDLPTIGPDTVDLSAAAGLTGIVIEAGGVMVLEREEVLARCNRAGLFLWVREADS